MCYVMSWKQRGTKCLSSDDVGEMMIHPWSKFIQSFQLLAFARDMLSELYTASMHKRLLCMTLCPSDIYSSIESLTDASSFSWSSVAPVYFLQLGREIYSMINPVLHTSYFSHSCIFHSGSCWMTICTEQRIQAMLLLPVLRNQMKWNGELLSCLSQRSDIRECKCWAHWTALPAPLNLVCQP